MRLLIITLLIHLLPLLSEAQYHHPFDVCSRLGDGSGRNYSGLAVKADVIVRDTDSVLFQEEHSFKTDSLGRYCFQLGKGKFNKGKLDSLIWSVGSYFLVIEFRNASTGQVISKERHLMREPENLNADHEQGSFEFKDAYGLFSFPHSRGKRPGRIQLDISTSYVNTAYPADTYPLYLHLEWIDWDRDGIGTAFAISYSQNSRNSFSPSTRKLGAITLYSSNFQEIVAESGTQQIQLELTRPDPIDIFGQTYKIKGPTTLIYYFEW